MFKLCIFLIVCILVLIPAQGQQKSCRAVYSDMNKKQLGWINDCVKQLGYKTGREKTQKSACVMKCVMQKFSMLNEEGLLDKIQFDQFLIEQWPEHIQDRANVTFQPCLYKTVDIDTSDEYCKGYEPLTKCLTRNFGKLCKGA